MMDFLRSFAIAALLGAIALAQAPACTTKPPAPAQEAPAASPKIDATLLQVMRGVLYPSSNVIFAAQADFSKLPPAADPSISPNPLTSTYGGWDAVENAALALSESANLITLPGRVCSNGTPAPVERADWQKYAQGLRDAGLAAYKAAESKNTDAMVDASGTVADACAACHDVYREKKGGTQDRCMP